MQKRNLVLGLIALLVVIAGTWGMLYIRARASAPGSSKNAAVHPGSTSQTSLYRTGTLVVPTVNVSTSTTNCDPRHLPGVASDPAHGVDVPAIKPHLCSIPTFTLQDVRQYMRTVRRFEGFRIGQTSPSYTVTRILFVTNRVANAANGLNADTGIIDPDLIVCYVEVYGDFSVGSGPPGPASHGPSGVTPVAPPVLHHGELVFDGVTGKILVMGVTP